MLFVVVVIFILLDDTHLLIRNLKQYNTEAIRISSTGCNPMLQNCKDIAGPSPTPTQPPKVAADSATLASILVNFKNSMINSKDMLTSWQGTDPCAGWVHVVCSGKEIIKLSLPIVDVGTSIPKELSLFQNLEVLQFTNVKLIGTIPPELSSLEQLRIIELDSNSLTGTIPKQFSMWENVEFVDFQFNQLSGTLPPQFSMWRSLKDLYLTSNQLTGIVPQQYGVWQNFNSIFLAQNQFQGQLPMGWESSDKVHFSHNNLK